MSHSLFKPHIMDITLLKLLSTVQGCCHGKLFSLKNKSIGCKSGWQFPSPAKWDKEEANVTLFQEARPLRVMELILSHHFCSVSEMTGNPWSPHPPEYVGHVSDFSLLHPLHIALFILCHLPLSQCKMQRGKGFHHCSPFPL